MERLTDLVAETWTSAADRDWTARAGLLEWTCLETADHAVDTVLAPAVFLASRQLDRYPNAWGPFRMGDRANPASLVEALRTASRILVAVVADAPVETRAVIWRRPVVEVRPAPDFLPRAALELALHAHDVCIGLAVDFRPDDDAAAHLRDHTIGWPMWEIWQPLERTEDPWGDLLRASGRIA